MEKTKCIFESYDEKKKRIAIILGVVNTILLGVPGAIAGLVYLVKKNYKNEWGII